MAICDSPSFLWSTMTSPLCLLTIVGYLMLLISPLTRTLARDLLDELKYIVTNAVQLAWRFRGTSPLEFEQLKQSCAEREARLLHERDAAAAAYAEVVADKAEMDTRAKKLRDDNADLRKVVRATERQLSAWQKLGKEAPAYQAKVQLEARVKYLEAVLKDQDGQLATAHGLENKVIKLEQALTEKSSALWDARLDAKAAAAREGETRELIEQLQAAIKQQAEEHKSVVWHKDQVAVLHHRVVEVLHQLAEQTDPERLSVAVLFAKALQLAGIKLADLGIDQRRFDLLCQFVAAGMRSDLPIQPQGYERGFRFKTTIVASASYEMPKNIQPFIRNSIFGPSFGSSRPNAGSFQQPQHLIAPASGTSPFGSFGSNQNTAFSSGLTPFSDLGKSNTAHPITSNTTTTNNAFTNAVPTLNISAASPFSDLGKSNTAHPITSTTTTTNNAFTNAVPTFNTSAASPSASFNNAPAKPATLSTFFMQAPQHAPQDDFSIKGAATPNPEPSASCTTRAPLVTPVMNSHQATQPAPSSGFSIKGAATANPKPSASATARTPLAKPVMAPPSSAVRAPLINFVMAPAASLTNGTAEQKLPEKKGWAAFGL